MDKPMKRIAYAALATVSGIVLLFSYRTSTGAEIPTTDVTTGSSTSAPTGSAETGSTQTGSTQTGSAQSGSAQGGSTPTGSASPTASAPSSGFKDGTYTGDAARTRYGPVQVQISVSGGQIASVDVVDYPTDSPRDRQINEQAVPMLVGETTSAQSAQIDLISGATYTSQGYAQSLQSAIDQAQS